MVLLPACWSECLPLKLNDDRLDGRALLVFMTKGVIVTSATEMNVTYHAQRVWRSRMSGVFGDGPVRAEQIPSLAMAYQVDNDASLSKYYKHCSRYQRDLSSSSDQDLDYFDLFCDIRRTKRYITEIIDGVEISYTMASAVGCLLLHPGLMEASWDPTHVARDVCVVWKRAEAAVVRYNDKVDSDGVGLKVSQGGVV